MSNSMTKFFKEKEINIGDIGIDEFIEKAKEVIESIPSRDVETEIDNIACINEVKKNMDDDVYEIIEKEWIEDEKALGITHHSNDFYKKFKENSATKEDLIRLCFYLQIPYENELSSKVEKQRFNCVRNFMQNLMLNEKVTRDEYSDVEEGLSYRRYEDVFWIYALKLPPKNRPRFSEIKAILNKLEGKLLRRLESLKTFDEVVEFYFIKNEVYRIYVCLHKDKDKYFNKIKTDFLDVNYKELSDKFNNQEETYNVLMKFDNQVKGRGISQWNVPFNEMEKEEWFKLFEQVKTKIITTSLSNISEENVTSLVEEKIRHFQWQSLMELENTLSIDNDSSLEVIKLFANYSLSLKKALYVRLNMLQEKLGYRINGIFLSDVLFGFLEKHGKTIRNEHNINYNDRKYLSALKSSGSRSAFILVTLMLKFLEYCNEEKMPSAMEWYEILNDELDFIGLAKLDPLNPFDALIVMIASSGHIEELLEECEYCKTKDYVKGCF